MTVESNQGEVEVTTWYSHTRVEKDGQVTELSFLRLVPRGAVRPKDTYQVEADVDVDADGEVIGVSWIRHSSTEG